MRKRTSYKHFSGQAAGNNKQTTSHHLISFREVIHRGDSASTNISSRLTLVSHQEDSIEKERQEVDNSDQDRKDIEEEEEDIFQSSI